MRFDRFARDLKDLRGTYRDLAAEAARAEDEASYKLTVTARGFARRSRKVVDDKLNFSATLMRAGEVQAANRLLDEVQTEVRTEEAALMEQVHEAKVAQAVRKDRLTRLRFVRMVAVAVMGSMLMAVSAAGMAAVSYIDSRERDTVRETKGYMKVLSVEHELQASKLARELAVVEKGKVAELLLNLSMSDLRAALERLNSEDGDPTAVKEFLVSALPTPQLARELADTLFGDLGSTPIAAAPVVEKAGAEGLAIVERTKRKVKEESAEAKEETENADAEAEAEPTEEPADEETPTDDKKDEGGDESPSPDPIPQSGPFDASSGKDGDGGLLD
jgi:hypothetical protein